MAEYKKKNRWTYKQEQFIMNNYHEMKDEEMANALGRTLKSVRHKRQRLELEKISAGKGVLMTSKKFLSIQENKEKI